MKLRFFWVFFCIDALICAITLFFALTGSMSSFNIGIWIGILAVLTVIMVGSFWLKEAAHPILGTMLLLVLAIPGILYAVFILLVIVTKTPWN